MNTDGAEKHYILIPTDFTEVCENSINHGINLANKFNTDVYILHVLNKEAKQRLKKEEKQIEDLHNQLQALCNKFKSKVNNNIEYGIKEGSIYSIIGDTAKEIGARLIILGTHGKVGFQRLTGSWALKVITNSEIPVIVIQKRTDTTEFKNIVFPVTVTTKDRQKVNWAINIAKIFNSTIHIFPKYEGDDYFKHKIMNTVKQIKDIFEEHEVKFVDKVSESHGDNFAKQVIKYSEENAADLIMLMTSNESFALVAWEEQIMFNLGQIPVICINPKFTSHFFNSY